MVILTFITVALLAPFALSSLYLPVLRHKAFIVYQFCQDDLYKLITGYISLTLVFLEMVLIAKKRGRSWTVKVSIPGKFLLWRGLHVFLGVALLGVVLIHTLGPTGLNFNAIFLWVFFGVTLTALVGVVTETGVTESPKSYFGASPGSKSILPRLKKGPLIRSWRKIWLQLHIWLVTIFYVLLGVHVFLGLLLSMR